MDFSFLFPGVARQTAEVLTALVSIQYWAYIVPGAVGMVIAWCILLKKAGIPWGFHFIPFFGEFCHFKAAKSVDLYITRWGVIAGTLTMALIHLNMPAVDPAIFVVLFYLPSGVVLLIIHAIFCNSLAECYGRSGAFASGLFWLFPIFLMILAFSRRSRYIDDTRVPVRAGGTGFRSGSTAATPRKPAAPDWICLGCGKTNPDSLRFCPHCGITRGTRPERLPYAKPVPDSPAAAPAPVRRVAAWRCPACGTDVPDSLRFCSRCGKVRYEAAPTAAAVKTPVTPARPDALKAPTDDALAMPAKEAPVPPPAATEAPDASPAAPKVSLVKEPSPAHPVLEDTIPDPAPREPAPVLDAVEEPQWKCTVCGAYMPAAAQVCAVCGVNRAPDTPILDLPDSWWFCAACGTRNADRHQTCTNCGAPR